MTWLEDIKKADVSLMKATCAVYDKRFSEKKSDEVFKCLYLEKDNENTHHSLYALSPLTHRTCSSSHHLP